MNGKFLIDSQGRTYWAGNGEEKKGDAPSTRQATQSAMEKKVEGYTGEMSRDDPVPFRPVATMSYGQRVRVARIYESHTEFLDQIIRVGGWAKSTRASSKELFFVELNDGSCFKNLQVVITKDVTGFAEVAKSIVGASFMFKGTLIKSPAKGQDFELQVTLVEKHHAQVLGHCDGSYPIQGRPTMETLRTQAHLRSRTNTFGAIARMRNSLAFATHNFFQQRGFLYVHAPIITASDCEGAGEMFAVTTVLPEHGQPFSKGKLVDKLKVPKSAAELKVIEDAKKKIEEEKAAKDAAEGKKPKKDKKKKKDEKPRDEDIYNITPIPLEEQQVDYKADMFGKPAFLSVSGQLNVECYAVGLSDCYTFGPTFRAENSHTSRHLCEFWMIEPEITFATINDDMDLAEDYLKFCLKYVRQSNMQDLEFFD